jgi:hypothetical protein
MEVLVVLLTQEMLELQVVVEVRILVAVAVAVAVEQEVILLYRPAWAELVEPVGQVLLYYIIYNRLSHTFRKNMSLSIFLNSIVFNGQSKTFRNTRHCKNGPETFSKIDVSK